MGENAKDAVPTVERVLATNQDRYAAAQAAHVLGSSADAATCERLARAIANGKDNFVRQSAIAAMGRLWPACPQTISILTGRLGGADRVASARALGKIGKPAMPALTAALKRLRPEHAASRG
jgi:hypothetical protein